MAEVDRVLATTSGAWLGRQPQATPWSRPQPEAATLPAPEDLLALVWGPRFDRDHARELWAQARPWGNSGDSRASWQAVMAVADRFDRLPAPRQHRVRRWLYHRWQATASGLH